MHNTRGHADHGLRGIEKTQFPGRGKERYLDMRIYYTGEREELTQDADVMSGTLAAEVTGMRLMADTLMALCHPFRLGMHVQSCQDNHGKIDPQQDNC